MPELALDPVHEATGTLLVVLTAQVVVVQLLLELAELALHEETPVGPVLTTGQLVAV